MDLEHFCPRYEKAVSILGKKWTPLILRSLMTGPRRFTEIADYVSGVSDRLLSQRLQELEEEGIIERKVMDTRPVSVEYGLTEKGQSLKQVIEAIQQWAERWEPLPELAKEASGSWPEASTPSPG